MNILDKFIEDNSEIIIFYLIIVILIIGYLYTTNSNLISKFSKSLIGQFLKLCCY